MTPLEAERVLKDAAIMKGQRQRLIDAHNDLLAALDLLIERHTVRVEEAKVILSAPNVVKLRGPQGPQKER
jgi:hypothetical protein